MNDCERCEFCDRGTLAEASEVASIPCNVREFRHERFTVWRCPVCRSLHCKEAIAPERYYARYPLARLRLNYVTRRIFGKRLRLLRSLGLRADTDLLDIGCGSGAFLDYLRERGYRRVTGCDPYSDRADPQALERTYALAVSYEVLEHCDRPQADFETYARCLEPDGLLAVQTPIADAIALADPLYCSVLHQPYHRHILSKQALLDLGDRAGLDLVTLRTGRAGNSMDTPFPFANSRLFVSYLHQFGGDLDLLFEPPSWRAIASPQLLAFALFGYVAPLPTHVTGVWRRRSRRA